MPTTATAQTNGLFHEGGLNAGLNAAASLSHLDHVTANGDVGGLAHPHRGSTGSALLDGDSRAMQLAMELALLQGNSSASNGFDLSPNGSSHHNGHSSNYNPSDNPLLHPFGINPNSIASCNGVGGSLEDLKQRRSQNMTECVPVPTSEHVAEIVGRQGKKSTFPHLVKF